VIHPNTFVPTSVIFSAEELTRNTEKIKISDFLDHFPQNGFFGKNDLQPVAVKRYPLVSEAIEWLGQYAHARMTGSGACVFACFENEEAANRVLEKIPNQWRGYKARGLKTHPLDAMLKTSGRE
jgi:4-diphosphocytidyl-2-C-methyl-D-erythritol kinase